DGGRLEELADWGSKLQGAAWRLAGILHSADAPDQSPGHRPPVPAHVMERAIRLARFFLEHGLVAFGVLDLDPRVNGARRILGWLHRGRRAAFTVRDVQYWVGGTLSTREGADPCLRLLLDLGYIRALPRAPSPDHQRGRPPSQGFVVSPLFLASTWGV